MDIELLEGRALPDGRIEYLFRNATGKSDRNTSYRAIFSQMSDTGINFQKGARYVTEGGVSVGSDVSAELIQLVQEQYEDDLLASAVRIIRSRNYPMCLLLLIEGIDQDDDLMSVDFVVHFDLMIRKFLKSYRRVACEFAGKFVEEYLFHRMWN